MSRTMKLFKDFITATVLCGAVLAIAVLSASKVVDSPFYRQSRVISLILQQDTIGITGVLEDRRHLDMLVEFASALTSAYINFEMIPVNEAPAFVAVFESLPDDVTVESFEYRRKDLHITGFAGMESGFQSFVAALRDQDRFSSVTGNVYESTTGAFKFEIICSSRPGAEN